MAEETKGLKYSYGLFNLWISFTLGMGAFILMIVLSHFFNPFQFPLISFFISFALFAIIRIFRRRDSSKCMLIAYIIARTLAEYTVIIFLILMTCYYFGNDFITLESRDGYMDILIFPILILSPILLLNTIIVAIKKNKCTFCTLCLLSNGAPSERSVSGKVHSAETILLVRQIFIMNVILSVVSWGYYIFLYNNANINSFDVLVFTGIPIILWAIYEVSIAIRCWVLTGYCERQKELGCLFIKDMTMLRYILVSDNMLYMSYKNVRNKTLIDTNIFSYIPFQTQIPTQQAALEFEKLTGIGNGKIKFIYSFNDSRNNSSVYNYIYFIDTTKDVTNINGEWIPLTQIEKAFVDNELCEALRTQIHRIYTAMLAYKTYNSDGTRKFKIKSYKPSLSLDDIKNIDIDYSDPKLMLLSVKNEDARFYKIKRWWFKYIEGLID